MAESIGSSGIGTGVPFQMMTFHSWREENAVGSSGTLSVKAIECEQEADRAVSENLRAEAARYHGTSAPTCGMFANGLGGHRLLDVINSAPAQFFATHVLTAFSISAASAATTGLICKLSLVLPESSPRLPLT
jgi:hypothetical protein